MFLPAADIPTFVGEGQVDLGITGLDQVQEHDAGMRYLQAHARSSGESIDGAANTSSAPATSKPKGCETVLDLGFGACKLQVQVPQNGSYAQPSDLVGKNIGTSFVHLAEEYFARLEQNVYGDEDASAGSSGTSTPKPRKLRTKIIELSGSVEAACALGVADGIVDLVGKFRVVPGFF